MDADTADQTMLKLRAELEANRIRRERAYQIWYVAAMAALAFCLSVMFAACATGDALHLRTKSGAVFMQCHLPIAYAVSQNVPTRFDDSIRDAFAYWNGVAGRKIFLDAGRTPYAPNDPESSNILVIGLPDMENIPPAGHPAVADVIADQDSGCIYRSSIWLRPSFLGMEPGMTVSNLMRHELGHVLGLDHNPEMGGVMHAYWPPFGEGRADDEELAAFRSMYGGGR